MKKVLGVGINDAGYCVTRPKCKIYVAWAGMLRRCYSEKVQSRQPTYVGCRVVPEWHRFSKFREWYLTNEQYGEFIDKDLIGDGKTYGPDHCLMVSRLVNNLFTLRGNARGGLPLGVVSNPNTSKFGVYVSKYGKNTYIGAYTTKEEAGQVYLEAKAAYIKEVADSVTCPKTKAALLAKPIT